MKKCLYCNDLIDTDNDDYQKVGKTKKIVCVFCYEDYADEIDNNLTDDDDEEDNCREEE